MTGGCEPNACAACPRTGCSLFDGLCGGCAFPHLQRKADAALISELESLRAENAALCAELARTRRALRREREAGERLEDALQGGRSR